MEKNLPQPKYRKSLKMEIAQRAWDSHYWIENLEGGYWHCKWCGAHWISGLSITEDYDNVCKENPLIKKLLKEKLN